MSNENITEKLDRKQARKLLSQFLKMEGKVTFTEHAEDQMYDRNLTIGDVLNVLRAGQIYKDAEFENGSFRYRVQTKKMTVVFAFKNPDKVRIVSAWRNQ